MTKDSLMEPGLPEEQAGKVTESPDGSGPAAFCVFFIDKAGQVGL